MAGSWGYAAQLGIGTTSTVDQRLDFLSENLVCNEEFVDTGGLRGTRSHVVERIRAGIRRIGGTITMQPTAVELTYLLPWIMGANASGTTFALADALQSRYVNVDRIAKRYLYSAVWVDSATFRASQGSPLSVTLNLVGSDETESATSFPSLTLDTTTNAYMFFDLALVIGGSTYSAKDFELTINNNVDRDRIFNSQTLSTSTSAMDRHVTMRTHLPHGDATAAYNTGSAGVAVTATFTNGATSLLFSQVKVCFPRRSPSVGGRQEILLPLEGTCMRSGSTLETVVTLDSVP